MTTNPKSRLLLCLAISGLWLWGCTKVHIDSYVPKRREYKSPVDFGPAQEQGTNGSLFHRSHAGTYLFADHRAMRIGDIVTVRIEEQADAKRGATTDLSRDSETNLKMQAFVGLMAQLNSALGLTDGNLISTGVETMLKAKGQTSRSEHLEATVPAIVREVLPSGNLFIEGHRVILVNEEEHHFYLSGVVRPVDIQGDNSVTSSMIADAEIEFTGRGVITDKQGPSWLHQGLDKGRPL
mgnify:CR=1 FL=1